MVRNKKILLHISVLTLVILIYCFSIGPMTLSGGELFRYKDWLFPVLGMIVVTYLFSAPSMRRNILMNPNWRSLFVLKNVLLIVGSLLIVYLSYKYVILIDPFASSYAKRGIKYGIPHDYSLVILIAMITIGPLWEELYFREVLLGQLRKYIPLWICIVPSILLFGMLHLTYPLHAIVMGIVFTTAYLRTGSWVVSFVIHASWNLYILLVSIL
ncbi:CPBP family intramembrane glutamic endopeptidase [Virgibacillus flavescens]|uniref:CPBP family intramembrane glutamic endopeptidase n=1 Tax=Virgibacillus flavescens TaxID=1611422 RepID=UPI003D357B31